MRVAVAAAKNEVVKLSKMDFEEASELLQTSSIKYDGFWAEDLRDEQTVTKLLDALTCLPLAITQATAYMNTNQMSVKDYLQLFEHADDRNFIELLEHGQDDETYYDKSQCSVATTWIVSFNQIRSSDPTAAAVLSFMSTIEPRVIPRSLLPIPGTEQRLEKAIGTLLGYGFLTRRGQEATYDMHRLVHLATRRWNEEGQHAQEVQQMALAHVTAVFPGNERENRDVWLQYLPHAERLLDTIEDVENADVYFIGFRVGTCLSAEWHIERGMHRLNHVNMIHERTLPENHRNRLATQYMLATGYIGNGQHEKGIRLLEHVVNVERGMLEEGDPSRLASQRRLAEAYTMNGQIQEAIELLEHVVAIQGKLTEDDGDRLISQYQLAVAYSNNGQIKEAVELLEYVVARGKKILPSGHPGLLKVVAESAVGLTSHTQSSMAPSSPQINASQAPQNRPASPCVEQIPSLSKTERERPPSTRVRDKNKVEDSDCRDEKPSTSVPAQEGNVTRQVDDAPPTRLIAKGRRQGRRKRLAGMEVSINGEASSTERKKPKTTHLNSDLIDDLQSVIGSTSSAMNEYIIRTVGAEDMEVAIRNCTQLFMESHGVHFVIRVIHWLRKDPINAVVWNALEGKELKEALVRSL
jgi:hypothetical protein